ncbi:MAG: hypothetical protein HS105_05825 [Chloracidobacterium sp.]|nr:hypothetical protein [Chloracidobacterium sp.]
MKRIVFINNSDLELPKIKIGEVEYEPEQKRAGYLVPYMPKGFDSHFDGETIFVIDVHCRIHEKDNLQDQAGLTVYRYLLKCFTGRQDKLKVIFYSPIPVANLIKNKPENYVLKVLPFVECKYACESTFIPADDEADGAVKKENYACGNLFERDLISILVKDKWPQFNNASENLLSGWALVNKEKIQDGNDSDGKLRLNEMSLLIIDDELASWAHTYQCIFHGTNLPIDKLPSQQKFKEVWNNGNGIESWLELAKRSDAILSDLYIEENHEDTNPYKSISDLEKISGYKLFKRIKEEYPYLPYMMFTLSNKVWNADAFRSEGVWAWAVKETSLDTTRENKKAQFEHFEACIKKLVDPECRFYAKVWKRLLELKKAEHTTLWWHTKEQDSVKIIEECILVLDTVFSQRSTFETKKVADFEGRLCSVVLNNIGGLCEVLEINPDSGKQNVSLVASYIWRVRSFYSHKLSYRRAKPLEVLFCVDLFIGLLLLDNSSFEGLETRKMLWKDDGRPDNANINYFRQFDSFISECGITFVREIRDSLADRFKDVNYDVISDFYDRRIAEEKRKVKSANAALAALRAIKKMNTQSR